MLSNKERMIIFRAKDLADMSIRKLRLLYTGNTKVKTDIIKDTIDMNLSRGELIHQILHDEFREMSN